MKISTAGHHHPHTGRSRGQDFIAPLPRSQADDIIRAQGLRRYTERSIVDAEGYFEALSNIRARGYALDDQEYLSGVRAVAMGLDEQQGLMLTLWVVGFANAFG